MLPTKDHRDHCNFSTTGLGIKFQRSTFHRASAELLRTSPMMIMMVMMMMMGYGHSTRSLFLRFDEPFKGLCSGPSAAPIPLESPGAGSIQ